MKAAQYNVYGEVNVIEINTEAKKPPLNDGQVLVEVYAASINPVESSIRKGYLKQMLPLEFPITTGGDFAGVIVEMAEDVKEFKTGQEVYGSANQFKGGSGAVAEFVAANSANTGLKPKSIDYNNASSLPLVAASALQAIEEHINLTEGQKILIHGGAGGVGSIAIQIAKMHKAYVITTASKKDEEFVKSLGADEFIDYKNQDITELVKDLDAVFDTAGGETTNKSLSVIKKGGILVSMAGQANEELAKKHDITALTQMTQANTEQLNRIAELVDSGKIKPQVHKTFPISQTKEAYQYLETEHPSGKVTISIKD